MQWQGQSAAKERYTPMNAPQKIHSFQPLRPPRLPTPQRRLDTPARSGRRAGSLLRRVDLAEHRRAVGDAEYGPRVGVDIRGKELRVVDGGAGWEDRIPFRKERIGHALCQKWNRAVLSTAFIIGLCNSIQFS